MRRINIIATACALMACMTSSHQADARTTITDLRVQNSISPNAIEDKHPLFSWKMDSDERGQKQTAYRIQVVRDSDGSVLWDTGRIEDNKSVGVAYQGVALQPEKTYTVSLSVWDAKGTEHQLTSGFGTGLMNPKQSAWKGAQFIGSHANTLDAASQSLFSVRSTFQIRKGDSAAWIIGADDPRLNNSFMNDRGVQGRNYLKVVFDLSGVDTPKGAELRIYRVGYDRGDSEKTPFIVVNGELYPDSNINEIFREGSKSASHTVEMQVETGSIKFIVDGKDLLRDKPRATRGGGFGGFSVGMTGGTRSRATSFAICPIGTGGNFPTFPNLNKVGFAAAPGSEVVYTDYQILNDGQSVDRVVFDSTHGAGYSIFSTIPGAVAAGQSITVSNSTSKETMGWADPSHGSVTMLRTEFAADSKKIRNATLYATSMGIFNVYLNGSKVGEDWFAPGDSQYRETLGYLKYDVTDMVTSGANALGAVLAGGWYTGYMTFTSSNFNFFGDHEALLARLVITYEDGSKQEVITRPESWKVFKDGPVSISSFFQGERYDASREAAVRGWDKAGFDDSAWAKAEVIERRDWVDFDIVARYDGPVRVRETLDAKRVMPVHNANTYIYDMGVNMVGVPSITIPAGWLKKGDTVILTYGEQLYPGLKGDSRDYVSRFGKRGRNIAGQILYETNRAAMDMDFYTAEGSEEVTIQPGMTFRGYQYIQIHIPSHDGPLPVENVKGIVLSSCEVPTGTYEAKTTDTKTGVLVNQLFRNIQRSQLGNMLTIPTDCPQRNERMGWTGDAQAYTRTGIYNADLQNFLRQWMVALRDDQGVGSDTEVPGGIGSTVPTYNKSDDTSFANGTTWAGAVCMVPWQMYVQYGDTQIVEENIEAMMDWLNGMAFYKASAEYPYLSSKASGLADHLAFDTRTPPDILNNAIYIYLMECTAVMAEAIGRHDYAQTLRTRHELAKADWNAAYVNPSNGKTRSLAGKTVHTQASYATPLNFNVFSDANRALAEKHLADLVMNPAASGQTAEELAAENGGTAVDSNMQGVLGSGNTDFNFKPYTITTGFSGTPNILPALSRGGYGDVAYRLFTNTAFPSWLYPVTEGATSMWERWNSLDTAFSEKNQNSMNSFNHFALGAVGQWMYEFQLGITTDHGEGEAGYQHFVLQPSAAEPFSSLEGSYDSNYGRITSTWTAVGGNIVTYSATVPANTSATLYLPVGDGVAECSSIDGARFSGIVTRNGKRCARVELASGRYDFTITSAGVLVK